MSEAQSPSLRLIRIQGYSAELTDGCGILVSSETSSRRMPHKKACSRAIFAGRNLGLGFPQFGKAPSDLRAC